jgi:undecaprenyl-diphosphatase
MNLLQAILLGIVQGLTEFLPVSSSAHLVLVPYFLGWKLAPEQVLPFDTIVQLGTLLAVVLFFWKDLWIIIAAFVRGIVKGKPFADVPARLGWYLILATIPAGLLGLLIKKQVDEAFQNPTATAFFLFVTAGILLLAEWLSRRSRPFASIGWLDALWMGIGQAISIFPGVSRSGASMSSGLLRNLDRRAAARFAFLMSVPVFLAAGALEIKDALALPGLGEFLPLVLVGFLAAAVVGFFSIRWLLAFVASHSLRIFALYCAVLGCVALFVIYVLKV